jgi:hypothetical protein
MTGSKKIDWKTGSAHRKLANTLYHFTWPRLSTAAKQLGHDDLLGAKPFTGEIVTPNRIRINRPIIQAQTCYVSLMIRPLVYMPECRLATVGRWWWLSNKNGEHNTARPPNIDINKPLRLTCLSNAVRECETLSYMHSAVSNSKVQNCF